MFAYKALSFEMWILVPPRMRKCLKTKKPPIPEGVSDWCFLKWIRWL